MRRCLALVVMATAVATVEARPLPLGFQDQPFVAGWDQAVGVAFGFDGRAFVWETPGRVWLVENGIKADSPLLDIVEEVGAWAGHGMLGFAIDPDFENNGYIYVAYVVDYHHLAHFGTKTYDPAVNEYYHDTIGRVTRYTCNAADGFRSVDPASRHVLIGESMATGVPILHEAHSMGALVFGADGTLIVGAGDGGTFWVVDDGGPIDGSSNTALMDGIITPKEDVGSWRAQLVDSHSGKLMRIDPATGDGVASNPFYDPEAPRSPRSRMWALGLRNPFRYELRPGTGDPDPNQGNPGALYIGDVGWNLWEEIDVCTAGGQNFGWPAFEGHTVQTGFNANNQVNQDAPNPLYDGAECAQEFFEFRELIVQETLGQPSWPNPCDPEVQIPSSIPVFMHRRPAIDWAHSTSGPARLPTFTGDDASTCNLNAAGCLPGRPFGGNSSTGGAWYSGVEFPPEYHNTYFHADYINRWIRNFVFDENEQLVAVRDFHSPAGFVVDIEFNPHDGALYYINYNDMGAASLRRVTFAHTQCSCPGDVDCDDAVGVIDLQILLFFFGRKAPAFTSGDLDGNGFVDLDDLNELLLLIGTTCPTGD